MTYFGKKIRLDLDQIISGTNNDRDKPIFCVERGAQ